jgi:hypothetical protein
MSDALVSAPPKAGRRLAPCAVIALEVIAAAASRHLRLADFELWMHQRGCDVREVGRALGALDRRGWASVAGSSLLVSEAGYHAATEGAGLRAPVRKSRKRRERMPRGLL